MSDTIAGSCLCSAIKYTVNGPIKVVANCHCNTCKKITGGVFATVAVISENDFEITEGLDDLTNHQVSENLTKCFCHKCGTPIFNLHKKFPGNYMTQVGSLDDPSRVTPSVNVFCESMLPWIKSIAGLPSFDQEPPKQP